MVMLCPTFATFLPPLHDISGDTIIVLFVGMSIQKGAVSMTLAREMENTSVRAEIYPPLVVNSPG